MKIQTKQKTPQQIIEHQRNVTSAAYTYNNLGWITTMQLANSFGVSENTIANWFCEAIEKGYVSSETMCRSIMEKHVAEYENTHHIRNSCLRGKYHQALIARSKLAGKVDMSAITGVATA